MWCSDSSSVHLPPANLDPKTHPHPELEASDFRVTSGFPWDMGLQQWVTLFTYQCKSSFARCEAACEHQSSLCWPSEPMPYQVQSTCKTKVHTELRGKQPPTNPPHVPLCKWWVMQYAIVLCMQYQFCGLSLVSNTLSSW